MRNQPWQVRQGDVFLAELTDADLTDARPVSGDGAQGILARGEATGHMHRLEDLDGIILKRMVINRAERLIIDTRGRTEPTRLIHGPKGRLVEVKPGEKPMTHRPIEIPPGKVIQVILQREGSDDPRLVRD